MAARGAPAGDIELLYRKRFRAFLLSMTALLRDGEAARDVVQDGFASALRRRRSFRGDGDLEAWLWSIVVNAARDRLRDRERERSSIQLQPAVDARDDADDGLKALVLALPERQRLAVFLRYYADLSYDQIAAALGVTPGTVAASLNAAHAALRRQLEEVAT